MTTLRTNLVQVFVFRRDGDGTRVLQLRRVQEPLAGSWQPVMGHAETLADGVAETVAETAAEAAMREVVEETGLGPPGVPGVPAWLGFWQLDGVHPFFVARTDTVYLAPAFAAEAPAGWEPVLNDEHDAHRWVAIDEPSAFVWVGQRESVRELAEEILGGTEAAEAMRLG